VRSTVWCWLLGLLDKAEFGLVSSNVPMGSRAMLTCTLLPRNVFSVRPATRLVGRDCSSSLTSMPVLALDFKVVGSILAAAMMREPFSRFNLHYDRFMVKYVDYKGWVDYVVRVFGRFRSNPKTLLDLACGTGIPTLMLARRGYRMTGVDRSPEMLAVLESKRGDLPVATIHADIRDFTVPEPLEAAICLYDSMNYLLTEDDLVRCFRCARAAVMAGGLFVFDVNTVFGLAEHWGTRTTAREVGDIYSIWQHDWDGEARVSTLTLTFWEKPEAGKTGEKFVEIHQERGYHPEEIERCLKNAGFTAIRFFQHGSFIEPGPQTTRMMVVAR